MGASFLGLAVTGGRGWGPPCDSRRPPPPLRFHNKGVYVRVGLQKISHSRSLHREIRLQVERREVELPSIEGLIFINIPRCRWARLPRALALPASSPACALTCVPSLPVQLGLGGRPVGLRQ